MAHDRTQDDPPATVPAIQWEALVALESAALKPAHETSGADPSDPAGTQSHMAIAADAGLAPAKPAEALLALAMTDGAHLVSGRGLPLSGTPRHPLSGETLELPPFVKDSGPPPPQSPRREDWALCHWLARPERARVSTGQHFPLSSPRMPDHTVWHRADFAIAMYDALVRGKGSPAVTGKAEGRPALLTLTFGSPQAFIAAARKTSDLWSGSYLLSFLGASALACLVKQYVILPEAIVFPALRRDALFLSQLAHPSALPQIEHEELESILAGIEGRLRMAGWQHTADQVRAMQDGGNVVSPSLPNRALLLVPEPLAATIASRFNDALQRAWTAVADEAGRRFDTHVATLGTSYTYSHSTDPLWDHQIKTFLPMFWGSARWPTGNDDLASWKREVFDTLFPASGKAFAQHWSVLDAAVDGLDAGRRAGSSYGLLAATAERVSRCGKRMRVFEPWQGAPREKDTISGDREQLAPDSRSGPISLGGLRRFWTEVMRGQGKGNALKTGTFREHERLDAVGVTKRIFPILTKLDNYPSTSHLATRRWADRLAARLQVPEPDATTTSIGETLSKFLSARDKFIKARSESLPVYEPRQEPRTRHAQGEHPIAATHPFRRALTELNSRDRGFLYPGEYALRRQDPVEAQIATQRDSALKELTSFLEACRDGGLPQPPVYYAMMFLDGDEMGRWSSGKKAPRLAALLKGIWSPVSSDQESWLRPLTPAHQVNFSECLATFSALARRIVESGHGTIIYAGGDDVLAMVPAETCLKVAHLLRFAFSGQIRVLPRDDSQPYKMDLPIPLERWRIAPDSRGVFDDPGGVIGPAGPHLVMGRTATLSGSVVVAHEKESLSRVLSEAREAEHRAKNVIGRNALAISIMKHSGELLRTGVRFVARESGRDRSQALETFPLEVLWRLQEALTPQIPPTQQAEPGKVAPAEDTEARHSAPAARGDGGQSAHRPPIRAVSGRFPSRLRAALAEVLVPAAGPGTLEPAALIPVVEGTVRWLQGRQVAHEKTGLRGQGTAAIDGFVELLGQMAPFDALPPSPATPGGLPVRDPTTEISRRSRALGITLPELVMWPEVLAFLVRGLD